MTAPPDDAEMAIRARLHQLIDGAPAAAAVDTAAAAAMARPVTLVQPQPQPQPVAQPTAAAAEDHDWWDALYAGDKPDAASAAAQPQPDVQPRNRRRIQPWWTGRPTDLTPDVEEEGQEEELGDDADDELDEGDAAAQPQRIPATQPRKPKKRHRGRTAAQPGAGAVVSAPAPSLSLITAVRTVTPEVRWLLVHASAAAFGAGVGLVHYSLLYAAWVAENGWGNVSAWSWLGIGFACECLRKRYSTHRLIFRWLAAVPVSSIVLGTLLYGTGWQNLEFPL